MRTSAYCFDQLFVEYCSLIKSDLRTKAGRMSPVKIIPCIKMSLPCTISIVMHGISSLIQ